MAKYRDQLPQLSDKLFITDGGIETTLIFREGLELPCFAAFDLLKNGEGRTILREYFLSYVKMARRYGLGFVLESATWRASADWGAKLGYSAAALAEANRTAIAMLHEIRHDYETAQTPMVISGCLGPRGDGYNPASFMSAEEAQTYHREQIKIFKGEDADMISAFTLTYPAEAIGIVRAARASGMPVAISFTVETDGKLPTGQSLQDAIEEVDEATEEAPVYYMINCAHPLHFSPALEDDHPWVDRICGIRANASKKSHKELDESTALDIGDPIELGHHYRELTARFKRLKVLGGCCGTDERHVEAICKTVRG